MTTLNYATRAASLFRRFSRDERGSTAIEYALIAAGIGGAIIVVVMSLGTNVKTKLYDSIANVL